MTELSETLGELNKRFGKNTIITGDEMKALSIPRVSTGSLSLDIETGGGLPYGRLVELFGPESAGKSVIAQKTAVNVQKDGKSVVWIDVEGSFDAPWAELLGVDISKIQVARPETGEEASDILDAVVRSGDCGLAVLDSTAALVPKQDVDKAMEDVEQIGIRAKMVNRLIRKLHSAQNAKTDEDYVFNSCLIIFINQIREKVGVMYGSNETTPGGRGLRHAASIRINLRNKWLKNPDNIEEIIGQTINFKIPKNKTFPPCRRGEFDFYTDGNKKGQIDLAGEVLSYGVLSGLIDHSGKSYVINKQKLVGRGSAKEYLLENTELLEELRTKILKHYLRQ